MIRPIGFCWFGKKITNVLLVQCSFCSLFSTKIFLFGSRKFYHCCKLRVEGLPEPLTRLVGPGMYQRQCDQILSEHLVTLIRGRKDDGDAMTLLQPSYFQHLWME